MNNNRYSLLFSSLLFVAILFVGCKKEPQTYTSDWYLQGQFTFPSQTMEVQLPAVESYTIDIPVELTRPDIEKVGPLIRVMENNTTLQLNVQGTIPGEPESESGIIYMKVPPFEIGTTRVTFPITVFPDKIDKPTTITFWVHKHQSKANDPSIEQMTVTLNPAQ